MRLLFYKFVKFEKKQVHSDINRLLPSLDYFMFCLKYKKVTASYTTGSTLFSQLQRKWQSSLGKGEQEFISSLFSR